MDEGARRMSSTRGPRRRTAGLGVVAIAVAVTVLASASLWAMTSPGVAPVQNNPAAQREQMIRLLRSVDKRLAELHRTVTDLGKRLPADKDR
ncbi:MAG: hypothetical protein AAF628_21230 [Planctomycetota bacterium]